MKNILNLIIRPRTAIRDLTAEKPLMQGVLILILAGITGFIDNKELITTGKREFGLIGGIFLNIIIPVLLGLISWLLLRLFRNKTSIKTFFSSFFYINAVFIIASLLGITLIFLKFETVHDALELISFLWFIFLWFLFLRESSTLSNILSAANILISAVIAIVIVLSVLLCSSVPDTATLKKMYMHITCGYEALPFPADKAISHTSELKELEVCFTVSKTLNYKITDNAYQHSEEFPLDNHSKRIIVKIKKLDPRKKAVRNKLFPDDYGPDTYLEDSKGLHISDPNIMDLAKRITGEERDALKISDKICKWIQGYIKYDFKALKNRKDSNRKDSLDILKHRTGVCSHYSILFTSLSRASGVPTRICSGLQTTGTGFGSHAWCEILCNNEWIPVDPTGGLTPAAANIIKLHEEKSDFNNEEFFIYNIKKIEILSCGY